MVLQWHDPEEMRALLAQRLRELRLDADWTQRTLARHAGVSLPTVRRFERTGRTSLDSFLRMCHALGHLDGLEKLLTGPPARSIAQLERQDARPDRRRGRR